MRAKRAKLYRKVMQFFQQSFGFREPYQVLVAPDFVLEAAAKHVKVDEALEEVLGGKVRALITFCGISDVRKEREGEREGERRAAAIAAARGFEKRRCPHREPVAGAACVDGIVGDANTHHYVLAVQDEALRARLRRVVAVPIVHIKQGIAVLEPVPELTRAAARERAPPLRELSEVERAMLKSLKAEAREARLAAAPPNRKRKQKGPKGPNPLSNKKRKKTH
ncbi:hypothetical protein H4R18_003630 [Coemansia javaensis]|uniref:U three protein 23 n=1 Tax=Coemansia javaensis TaxID=2761396 RepID=A0A9W8HBL7_9FUNG|nr:hypothetical protein H4R18_003630 [Coemansia javaensis]